MKKIIIFAAIGLLVISVLIGYSLNFFGKSKISAENGDTDMQSSAWLEVTVGKVFELQTDEKTVIKELASGDYITEGMIIKTDAVGKAIIYFSEGSELRLENETLVKIETGSFDVKSDSLKVQVKLVTGRTWSKIIELATPDSEWEVKTSNAVATVRGTAFGMEAKAGNKTKITGSENKVQVSVRNAKTNKLAATDLLISKDKVVEIDDASADNVLALIKDGEDKIASSTIRKFIAERQTAETDLKDGWIKSSEERDDKIRTKIQNLNNEGLDKKAVRARLREDVRKDFQVKKEQTRAALIENSTTQPQAPESINDPVIQPDKPVVDPTVEKPIVKDIIPPKEVINPVPQDIPIDFSLAKLQVVTKAINLEVIEGNEIQFNAIAVFPDGTRKDMTSAVTWSVSGYIGKVSPGGKFLAEITSEAGEQLASFGKVNVVLENPGKAPLKGNSELITVGRKPSTEIIPADIRS